MLDFFILLYNDKCTFHSSQGDISIARVQNFKATRVH